MGIWHCKQRSRRARIARLSLAAAFCGAAAGCHDPRGAVVVIEQANPARLRNIERSVVADPRRLIAISKPLARRLALVEVHDQAGWDELRACAPGLRSKPDFSRVSVVGLVGVIGERVDRRWPIHLDAARLYEGAALLNGSFDGGSYLPDGVSFIEVAQVDGLRRVLAVDLNGARYYPDEPAVGVGATHGRQLRLTGLDLDLAPGVLGLLGQTNGEHSVAQLRGDAQRVDAFSDVERPIPVAHFILR